MENNSSFVRLTTPLGITLLVILGAAVVVHVLIATQGDGDLGMSLFFGGMFPYVLSVMFTMYRRSLWPAVASTAAPLLFDLFLYYSVFIEPGGSTAALALIFAPFWNLILVVPVAGFLTMVVVRKGVA